MSKRETDVGGESGRCPPLAVGLLCLAFVLALLTAWSPTWEHIHDPSWTAHQRFHAFREIFLATVFSVAGLVVCLGPLRRNEPRALGAVALLGIGVVAGFWVGLPITGIGKGGIAPYVNHSLQVIALVAGCLLARSSAGETSRAAGVDRRGAQGADHGT